MTARLADETSNSLTKSTANGYDAHAYYLSVNSGWGKPEYSKCPHGL